MAVADVVRTEATQYLRFSGSGDTKSRQDTVGEITFDTLTASSCICRRVGLTSNHNRTHAGVLSCFLSYLCLLSCFVLSCLVLSCLALCCLGSCCVVLYCVVLSSLVVLFPFILSCLCLVFPCTCLYVPSQKGRTMDG